MSFQWRIKFVKFSATHPLVGYSVNRPYSKFEINLIIWLRAHWGSTMPAHIRNTLKTFENYSEPFGCVYKKYYLNGTFQELFIE